MIKVQNLSTGEVVNVLNVVVEDGKIVSEARRPNKGKRFYESYPMVLPAGTSEDGRDMHTLAEGWSLATKGTNGTKKACEPKQETVINPQVEVRELGGEPVEVIKVEEVKEVVNEVTEQAKAENITAEKVWEKLEKETNKTKQEVLASAAEVASKFVDEEKIRMDLEHRYGAMGADIFDAAMKIAGLVKPVVAQPQEATVNEEQVRSIVKEYFAGIKQECRVIEVKSAAGIVKVEGVVNKNFDIFCNLVNAGKPLYMYGPAGSGKSYTAKQIAEALGLDYYETSQAIFAYELKGYGDAAGKFVETAFYKAFANGGVFFLDEVDASAPEALVVLNNAIANKRFDFPVVGNVNAHPNFRVVAAGNTRMTGATMEYVARQMQDTSFKNRFFFETVTYDRNVFLSITGGDEEIVNFGEDLRRAANKTGISQLFSYRQASDLATLQECCRNDDAHLLRGSVLQEKTVDDALNLYEHLENKSNRWARAMKKCIEQMRNEEVW